MKDSIEFLQSGDATIMEQFQFLQEDRTRNQGSQEKDKENGEDQGIVRKDRDNPESIHVLDFKRGLFRQTLSVILR